MSVFEGILRAIVEILSTASNVSQQKKPPFDGAPKKSTGTASDGAMAGGGAATNATTVNRSTLATKAGGGAASSATIADNASIKASGSSNSSGNSSAADASQRRIHKTIFQGKAWQAVQKIGEFLEPNEKAKFAALSSTQLSTIYHPIETRDAKITSTLLMAVAYGMQDREVNVLLSDDDVPNVYYVPDITEKNNAPKKLFIRDFYAKDLLLRSPEYLLKRAHLTDWAGC